MANLSTIKNKKEELTAAQKKKLKAELEKKGFTGKKLAQALKKPYLYSNSAGDEPSDVMKAVMNQLKIGDELDGKTGLGSHYDWKGRGR